MKLYTRTGDTGETSLFDGTRVFKNDSRVAAYGELDELNALLGWCLAAADRPELRDRLSRVQADLFVLGAELATPASSKAAGKIPTIGHEEIARLEGWIDEASDATPALRAFILPGGTELAARLHIARAVSRRAERRVVSAQQDHPIRGEVIVYLNRLSDLLFAWARWTNHQAGCPETPWIPNS